MAENLDEVRWACELYPRSRSYLAVYDDFGLMRERAVYAHCIHFDAADRALMRQRRTAAAVSPTSNLFLGSGFLRPLARPTRQAFAVAAWPATWAGHELLAVPAPCSRPTPWGVRGRLFRPSRA